MAAVWGRKAAIIILSCSWASSSQIKYDPLSVLFRASSSVTSNLWPLFKNWMLQKRQAPNRNSLSLFRKHGCVDQKASMLRETVFSLVQAPLSSHTFIISIICVRSVLTNCCYSLTPICVCVHNPGYTLCISKVSICLKFRSSYLTRTENLLDRHHFMLQKVQKLSTFHGDYSEGSGLW